MTGNIKTYISLHVLLAIYAMTSVFSKLASEKTFLSVHFVLYYGLVILSLGIYAIGWQQIIKRMPLTAAFANKAVTVVWGIVWGLLFFQEPLTLKKVVGACFIVAGVVLYSLADQPSKDRERVYE